MELYECKEYLEDIQTVIELPLDWEQFRNRSVMISGATGMIGRFLIDVLMALNRERNLSCGIYALGRSEKKASERFSKYWTAPEFHFCECSISEKVECPAESMDYVFHFASNTHPRAYALDPIGTITANIMGTYHLLEYAVSHHARRFLFASSVEIYGQNRGDAEAFTESYCGYIDSNTLRAGYPESKRAGEALCQAYIKQKGLDIVIPRLSRTYGPTLLATDTKALTQFLQDGVNGRDIVLKSAGTQFFSYNYVADTVSGILWCLLFGESGEAYNVADEGSNITLRDLAQLIAAESGTKVVFELPDEVERQGFSTATRAIMDSAKLRQTGWRAQYDMKTGVARTLRMMRKMREAEKTE